MPLLHWWGIAQVRNPYFLGEKFIFLLVFRIFFDCLQFTFHPPDVRSWATLAQFPGDDVRATGLEEEVCWQCVIQALPSPPIPPLPPSLLLASFLRNKGRKSQGVFFPIQTKAFVLLPESIAFPICCLLFMPHIPTGEAFAVAQITFQGLFCLSVLRITFQGLFVFQCQHLWWDRLGVRKRERVTPKTIIRKVSHLLLKWPRVPSPANVCTSHLTLPAFLLHNSGVRHMESFLGNTVYL